MASKYNIDFFGQRKITAIVSSILILASMVSFATRGFNFGIDFTGGYLLEVGYQKSADLHSIREVLQKNGYENATVQNFGTAKAVLIRLAPEDDKADGKIAATDKETQTNSAKVSDHVLSLLKQVDSAVEMRRVEYVGPQVGDDLKAQGALAMIVATLGILAYIAFRFEKKLASGAVLALIHDIVITLGVLSVFQITFDVTTLAAVLAVMGYSLNDTIVIYDRIRENFLKLRKGVPIEVANISINETLSRTLLTSGATMLVLFALLIFGGEVNFSFSTTLLVGIFFGTYSSIYVASSAALWLKVTREDLFPLKKEEEKELSAP